MSFSVGPGERVGVIGPNGAGKSTLFRAIAGTERGGHGRVVLDGKNLAGVSARRRARLGIARTFQITELFGTLTVEENLRLAARSHDEVEAALQRFELRPLRARRVDELAYGQQRLVELAVAFATGAQLLLLDEPAAGLGAAERVMISEAIRQLPSDVTVLLIEHDMDLVLGLVDRVLCLSNGQLIADASTALIRENPAVREVYLGNHESEIAS